MRNEFLLGEKYRLDVKWSDVEYVDNTCRFIGAYFTGPVLQFAEKIEPNISMELDFFKQYFVLVDDVYIGTFAWGEVTYKEDKIFLSDCTLTHKSELHKVPKLDKKDMLVIDCKLHERETHDFYPTYKTYVANADIQVYNFLG
jgi:hypothetical protein